MANVSVANTTSQLSGKTIAVCENDQTISGAWTFTGNQAFQGNVSLGNAVGDTVTISGTIVSNLLFTDATYDIGATGASRPRDLFLSRNLTLGGVAGNLPFTADFSLRRNTTDGSDTGFLTVAGGGAEDESRGAVLLLAGNEQASLPGFARLEIGNVAGSKFLVERGDGTNVFQILGSTGALTVDAATALNSTVTIGGAVLASSSVLSAHATGGIGYATGAGGTVTQGTNKATGVTLNKITGRITMHNASLAAGAEVGFTVTNSAVAANDVIIVNVSAGATVDTYLVGVDTVAAGSFRIVVANVGATLGEAIQLSFAVIKGVNA